MPSRRGFLAGLLAAGMAPAASWADLGSPAYLSAGKTADGRHLLAGLAEDGEILFTRPLPARGHAATAHPHRPEAVGFARRPGRFADVIDCRTGEQLSRLEPPAGHHFYGHGVFTADGSLLMTTENDYEAGRGIIGVWDARADYRRIGSFASGGTGPHDMLLKADGSGLVVANGGIETHPDSGRAKLNIPTMRPNLSYLDFDGAITEQVELEPELHKNSIRHLAIRADGTVGFAMQWQGDLGADVPIVGLHRPGMSPRLMAEDDPRLRNLNGYGGSIAFTPDGRQVAVTSPRGSVMQVFDCESGEMNGEYGLADVCGLAQSRAGLIASSGTGKVVELVQGQLRPLRSAALRWDNHLIRLN
ncbi:DUF1513 domain-containing protein [Phaeobacter sp. QD34_3]|uniref:DUF1513 domain-containing protein n=1 Tax=unclassified Phaeobacter TaxID=2621772 RepID=UPI00237F472A|nr:MULTISPECIES: DUF1513 domain-containing protein [unclassified Phaeobacter]MDE4133841.1 DUF1513 domain-containing protein [Phaeobacter sp. QD34_3]MDE4137468.1 DUF1513 domain-containing protein [Phaeobacter sp. QD34_24]